MLIKDIAYIRRARVALEDLVNECVLIEDTDKKEIAIYIHRLHSLENWVCRRVERGEIPDVFK